MRAFYIPYAFKNAYDGENHDLPETLIAATGQMHVKLADPAVLTTVITIAKTTAYLNNNEMS